MSASVIIKNIRKTFCRILISQRNRAKWLVSSARQVPEKVLLVQLIPRLYDCDEGEVLVDGVNVKEYSLNHLRDGVAMVLQKNTLFSGSIMENLRWGDEEATDEQVKEAARQHQGRWLCQ